MKNNETGEFELVLGNKQLLSGFAIVVILFGVFFTMGYIVGRNSTPPAKAGDTASGLPAGSDLRLPSPVGEATPPAQAQSRPSEMPAQTAPAQQDPQQQATAPPAKEPEPAQKAEAPPAETKAAPPPPSSILDGGLYLQVRAVPRKDAETLMKSLQSRGYSSTIGPSSREGLFRVLVGPYKDAKSAGKAKGELEGMGFQPVVAR